MGNIYPNPYLLYDGECPFCKSASEYYKIKDALPGLQIISLRDGHALKPLNLPADLDFNQGMILIQTDGSILQGESAFRAINSQADISNLKDFFLVGVNSKPWISRWVYPVFFQLRKLALKLKNVSTRLDRVDLE